ncbi:MFS transporter [Hyphomonas pacifica]|uniref:MFS transporter n=1 Tax=Hyphomonas pacifica TaxID=1280941 RepID=UPI000DD38B21|nr:MFS transporter [Hyphomonas pacifica]
MPENTRKTVMQMLTSGDEGRVCKDIPESACNEESGNFLKHITSLSASKISDGLIDPKLVLSWLLTTLGAPAFIIGLLVPVREAGALLPQLFTAAALRQLPQRKWAWAVGSAVQGLSAACMALAALTLEGRTAGLVILGALAVLAIARSVCSVTYKDVLGKTVSKSRRGTATGTASTIGAAAVLAYGGLLSLGLIDRMSIVTTGLFLAGGLWVAAALLFTTLKEEPGSTEGGGNPIQSFKDNFSLLAEDKQLRRFILTRGLLISTALAPPFMVALGTDKDQAGQMFGGLGLLVIASAGAGLVSSYVWGRLADRSSRKVLILTAAAATIALAATLALHVSGLLEQVWALPLVLFGLMIAYQGVRLGRSTHLVDMASQETRAAYTALSNTIIGTLLVLGGGFSLVAEYAGNSVVIGLLAVMSALAIPAAFSLAEVQHESD